MSENIKLKIGWKKRRSNRNFEKACLILLTFYTAYSIYILITLVNINKIVKQ